MENPDKRKKYDELGANWQQYEKQGNQQGGNQSGQYKYESNGNDPFDDQSDFSDFFEQIFSGGTRGGGGRTQNHKGEDYETEMEITLEEAYHGTSRTIFKLIMKNYALQPSQGHITTNDYVFNLS